jgi:hypothetical protein
VNSDNKNDSIISIKFKESNLIALDSFLDLIKKQFSSIVADKTNITESERHKFANKLIQVDHLVGLIKTSAHN